MPPIASLAQPAPSAAPRTHSPYEDTQAVELTGAVVAFGRDQEIFGEAEPASHVYKVLTGAVRCFRVLSDGRRQISDFYLPGDVFGFEAGLDYRATAEALTDCQVVAARRGSLTDVAHDQVDFARALWRLAIADLQRSQDHVLTLGRRSAVERVASFLIDIADRLDAGDEIALPMTRQDMADYLGLTIETVSRTLSQLQTTKLIQVGSGRSIRLLDRETLESLCE